MKKYLFTIYLQGYGNTPDDAWQDATESTDLSSDPAPDKDDYRLIEGDEDE